MIRKALHFAVLCLVLAGSLQAQFVSVGPMGYPTPARILNVSTAQSQTGADTNETDLWSYSLPANTLSANGKVLRVTVMGITGATANNKTVKVYFGATAMTFFGPTNFNNTPFICQAIIVRTGASSQILYRFMSAQGTTYGNVGGSATPAENTAGAITIKVTGTNGTAAAGDVVFKTAIVEILN
jgi:hypothetical protein